MLDVTSSRELQATILALRIARRDVRREIAKTMRAQAGPLWKRELEARAHTKLDRKLILSGARVAASDRGVTLYAATSRRPLWGGIMPAVNWPAAEFGAHTRRVEVTQRSRRGRRYTRTMTINKPFRRRELHGVVAFDAASKTGTRIVAMLVRTTVDQFASIPTVEVVS